MNETEKGLLFQFLNNYSEDLSNNGCNDLTILTTPETRALVEAADRVDETQSYFYDNVIQTTDYVVLDYLITRLMDTIGCPSGPPIVVVSGG